MSWEPVESMPPETWCRTRREGENGENRSRWVDGGDGTREYWDREGYSTVINPGTFAEPTHWWKSDDDIVELEHRPMPVVGRTPCGNRIALRSDGSRVVLAPSQDSYEIKMVPRK